MACVRYLAHSTIIIRRKADRRVNVTTPLGFIPDQAGQPPAVAAWKNSEVNASSGGFYQNTLATMQDGVVRPRFNGYIAFQSATADIIREGLATRRDPKRVVAEINILFRKYKS